MCCTNNYFLGIFVNILGICTVLYTYSVDYKYTVIFLMSGYEPVTLQPQLGGLPLSYKRNPVLIYSPVYKVGYLRRLFWWIRLGNKTGFIILKYCTLDAPKKSPLAEPTGTATYCIQYCSPNNFASSAILSGYQDISLSFLYVTKNLPQSCCTRNLVGIDNLCLFVKKK